MPNVAVMASFQPSSGTILVVVSGGSPPGTQLEVEEARQIHAALGGALRIADAHQRPMEAVMGKPEELAG
jgi:hypothetical protein